MNLWMIHRLLAAAALAVGVGACGGISVPAGLQGGVGQPCYDNMTCNPGLECRLPSVCTLLSSGDATTTADTDTLQDTAADTSVHPDTATPDTGLEDTGVIDTSPEDTGVVDTSPQDTGVVDTNPQDTGVVDANPQDTDVKDTCIKDCAGKQCGDDGCGGDCGSCAANHLCDEGMCVCQPDCGVAKCGLDPVCATISCGECVGPEACASGVCVCNEPPELACHEGDAVWFACGEPGATSKKCCGGCHAGDCLQNALTLEMEGQFTGIRLAKAKIRVTCDNIGSWIAMPGLTSTGDVNEFWDLVSFWQDTVKSDSVCKLGAVQAEVTFTNPCGDDQFGSTELDAWLKFGATGSSGSLIFGSCGELTGTPAPQEVGRFYLFTLQSKTNTGCVKGATEATIVLKFSKLEKG